MLLRVKEETPEELAGFVDAARTQARPPGPVAVDIDWSSYAGKRRHAPWFIFALQLLADEGLRIFIHGAEGHTPERLYTEAVMQALGLETASRWQDVDSIIGRQGFCYLSLRHALPAMAELIDLRPTLGLRSPVHSLARLINPLDAPVVVQGIFHPPYAGLHQRAGQLLGYQKVVVFKGEGGEIERNPDARVTVYAASPESGLCEESWPALFDQRHARPEDLGIEQMQALWRGERGDEYATAAIIGTAAIALQAQRPALNPEQALSRAEQLWTARDRSRVLTRGSFCALRGPLPGRRELLRHEAGSGPPADSRQDNAQNSHWRAPASAPRMPPAHMSCHSSS